MTFMEVKVQKQKQGSQKGAKMEGLTSGKDHPPFF